MLGRIKPLILALATATATATLVACGSGGDDTTASAGGDGEPIKVGAALGLSGALEAFDGAAYTSAQLAVDDINAEGGVDGRELSLVSEDTKSDPEQAANAAIKLLEQDVDVLLVPCDFDMGGGTAATEAEKAGVLAVSTCGASVRFGPPAGLPLTFTMATSGAGEGSAMGEWAREELKADTAATIVDSTFLYGAESVGGFEGQFQATGGEIVASESMKNDDQSFATQISAIRDADPDVIYVSSYMPGEAKLLREIRRSGIDAPILADEDIDGEYWKGALSDDDLNDMYFVTYASIYGDDPDADVNDLVSRFEKAAGEPPLVAAGLMTGYSTMEAIAAAISESGGSTDGAELAATMQGWTDKEFLVGPTTFNEDLHITPVREERIMKIEDGDSIFHQTFRPNDVTFPEDVDTGDTE